MNDKTEVFMVVGVNSSAPAFGEDTNAVKNLVGISTDYLGALKLLNDDYVEVVRGMGKLVFNNPLYAMALGEETNIKGYSMSGYTWYIIPVNTNEVVNFTL